MLSLPTVATYGLIEEFNEDKGNSWQEYSDWSVFLLLVTLKTMMIKKQAVLLSVCGAATYSTLPPLLAPQLPAQVVYADIVLSSVTL